MWWVCFVLSALCLALPLQALQGKQGDAQAGVARLRVEAQSLVVRFLLRVARFVLTAAANMKARLLPTLSLLTVAAVSGISIASHKTIDPASLVSVPPPADYSDMTTLEVFFSPRGGCTEAIVREIGHATRSVKLQAYAFTAEPVARALCDAMRRGVEVEAILDKSQRNDERSQWKLLREAGVSVFIDEAHAIAHSKIVIVDGSTVLTGSFNFSDGAEKHNAENLVVIRDATLAARYLGNFERHKAHSAIVPQT